MVVLHIVGGSLAALVIDWAIYTHLSAYLQVGIPTTPDKDYSALAAGRPALLLRSITVLLSGALGGIALSSREPSLWLASAGLFLLAHALLYAALYKR